VSIQTSDAHTRIPEFARSPKKLLIGGRWVSAQSGETLVTENPATGEEITRIARGGAADVDAAVAVAQKAFDAPNWSRMNPHERTRLLMRIAATIEAHSEELALLETIDNGMPLLAARHMVATMVRQFEYFAGWPSKITGAVQPSDATFFNYTMREPLGVCGQIIPWNAPLLIASWKLGPALACGNTVVMKPAEQTSLSVLRVAELMLEAGLPEGVVNIVTGIGPEAGEAIVSHPGVAKIAFTGSTRVGKEILRKSADSLKKITLELGGKSPNVIFPDGDLDAALLFSTMGYCSLSGQVCVAGSRIFVHESVVDEVTDRLVAMAKGQQVGDPLQAATTMGPLVSRQQFERVSNYVAIGREEGATLLTGGGRVGERGYFHEPTIFAGVRSDMRIVREEIFGPVAVIIAFKDEDDAVLQGNATDYGLGAAVWTRDISKAHRVARGFQAGTVWVNTYADGDPTMPFGGYKQSGMGRENGAEAIESYTQTKAVFVRL
jgi:acyl-CoA reductase-like NAD-dependent aldehyde dehydrogenase